MLRTFLLLLIICPLFAAAQGPDSLWDPLPIRPDGQVGKLYADPATGDLYITAFGYKVNGQIGGLVKWDGNVVTIMTPPFLQGYSVAAHSGKLLVGGTDGPNEKLASFDGHFWTTLDSIQGPKFPLSALDGQIVVTGDFDSIAGHPVKKVALWDCDTGWRDLHNIDAALHGGINYITSVLRYKGEIYVAGNIYTSDSITHITRYNGTEWRSVGGGIQRVEWVL
jgi:hypothetical protein